MITKVEPGFRSGDVRVPSSKSLTHRSLICAALSQEETVIFCDGLSKDIEATIACVTSLGARVDTSKTGRIHVSPLRAVSKEVCHFHCGESGSTLRFLLPVVGALGVRGVFHLEGRLPQRPLAPLDEQLCRRGMSIRQEGPLLLCTGRLSSGTYKLPGDVSSQYITGLLLALPLLSGDSSLAVTGTVESKNYIHMTEDVLKLSQIQFERSGWTYHIAGGQQPKPPREIKVEGDYSAAAFFLCMGALSPAGVMVEGLNPCSSQGDKWILELLRGFGAEIVQEGSTVRVRRGALHGQEIDASQIPDLIPVLSVAAAVAEGETHIINAGRLRLKESDRLRSTAAMLRSLGGDVTESENGLSIRGRRILAGGEVDACGDHRIAMSAAAAAGVCQSPVFVSGSECVEKSYPRFWQDLGRLERSTG